MTFNYCFCYETWRHLYKFIYEWKIKK